MIYLQTNTADQNVTLTIGEAKKYLPEFTYYLLELRFMDRAGGSPVYQVVEVIQETERATTIQLTTEDIVIRGMYSYTIYGQNSDSNLDPTNATVVGICKQGNAYITDDTQYFNAPSITIPSNDYHQPTED